MESVIEGLKILAKYGPGHIAAEHDIIYAGPEGEGVISAEDEKRLVELRWHKSDAGCWAKFV